MAFVYPASLGFEEVQMLPMCFLFFIYHVHTIIHERINPHSYALMHEGLAVHKYITVPSYECAPFFFPPVFLACHLFDPPADLATLSLIRCYRITSSQGKIAPYLTHKLLKSRSSVIDNFSIGHTCLFTTHVAARLLTLPVENVFAHRRPSSSLL
eukprot:5454744-Pleurochrysis_carterae.AAC.2